MELRQLIAFKEVATHASFTAAATHLHLTQSAVSQQIKALEDECNVTLFDRSGRLVRLTNAGQVLLSHVERILAQVENARVEMAEMAGGARGRCRLASLPTIAAYLLPRALATFQRRYPGVEVQLMEARAAATPGMGPTGHGGFQYCSTASARSALTKCVPAAR